MMDIEHDKSDVSVSFSTNPITILSLEILAESNVRVVVFIVEAVAAIEPLAWVVPADKSPILLEVSKVYDSK